VDRGVAEEYRAEERASVGREDALVVGPRHDRQPSVRVVVEPLPVEVVVVGVVDVELALEGRRVGRVVELRPIVVDDVPVGRREDGHERMAFRVSAGRAGVDRPERDHALDVDTG